MNYSLSISQNIKTGSMPVSMSTNKTCPSSCQFKNNGCYAKYGPLSWNWVKISNGLRGSAWSDFIKQVRKIPSNTVWRHNQAGDLPGLGDRLSITKLRELIKANKGKFGYTYTHKPLKSEKERKAIKEANDNGFTINISANNLRDADDKISLGIGPVVSVIPINTPKHFTTPNKVKGIICPAQLSEIKCIDCKLCQKADRKFIIGFLPHGIAKKAVNKISEI
jgi:hypothetical protein